MAMNKNLQFLLFATTAIILPCLANAQQAPDAGRNLQQLRQPPQPSSATSTVSVSLPQATNAAPGGKTVKLKKIELHGNTVFTNEQLLAVIGNYQGKSYDLAGLKNIANQITVYYRNNGYPFALALILQQTMDKGNLRIEIIEGRYGHVRAIGKDQHAKDAQPFVDQLKPGSLIASQPLERATLLLNDQPGYKITPVVQPGQQVGTGDLYVRTERDKTFGGDIGVDNHGDRYTGQNRGTLDLYVNSPFQFGDQITLSTIYTNEDMWYGSLAYNAPLNASGLRGNVGYAHTYYSLGKDFSVLDAHGTADIVNAGVSYSLLRSQEANVTLAANYQHKWLNDQAETIFTDTSKSSDSVPLMLNFDRRDNFGGGGITYGALGWTHGVLALDSTLKAGDISSARTAGGYDKFNLDVARVQNLPKKFALFGRFSGQWSTANLDSSESFGLGGANGVRAYPTGEGYGDEGQLIQAELRYRISDFTPYTFYDAGHVKTNHAPWAAGDNNRTISGAGLGLRFTKYHWNIDTSLAWRISGGPPQSDSKDNIPVFLLSVAYKF
jgi:hemolysin activation/secretion protein